MHKKLITFFMLDKHGRLSAIDGLRAWAILSVFNVHLNPMLTGPSYQNSSVALMINSIFIGQLGVDLFFVISGFLIYRSIKLKEPTFIEFVRRRFMRLLPVHIAVLLSMMTVNSLGSNFLNIFFINYFFSRIPIMNFVSWSLSYEILFYLIAGLWLTNSYRFKSRNSIIFILLVISLEVFYLCSPKSFFDGSQLFRLPDVRFIGLFAGLGAGMIYESPFFIKIQKYIPTLSIFATIACIFNWSVLQDSFWGTKLGAEAIYSNIYYGIYDILFGIICLGVCITNYSNPLKQLFDIKLFRYLGIISYSFYLSHAIFGIAIASRFIEKHKHMQNYLFTYLFSLAISIVVACFLFKFLEKPYFISKKLNTS